MRATARAGAGQTGPGQGGRGHGGRSRPEPARAWGAWRARLFPMLLMAAAACGSPGPPPDPAPQPAPRPMPEVRVEQVAGGDAIAPETFPGPVVVPEAELAALERGERITLTAQDTDLRALLAALAEAAGVNLVVSPEVAGRVTVHLENVPAREALETVIRESGHMITEPLTAPWGPVVFYVSPVNIETMTAEEIQAHFGVSAELARFIVRARVPR